MGCEFQSMPRIKKTIRILLRIILGIVLLLILIAGLIQIPAIQQYLTGKLESYLQNKFKTEVRIETLRLQLPESLTLGGVYLEDSQKDTLLNVEELTVNFKLNQLLSKRIQFDKISLNQGMSKIHLGRDSANFDFILNAFGSEQESTELPEPEKKDSSESWEMTFDDAYLQILGLYFQYKDEENGLDLKTEIGELSGKVKTVDYLKNDYFVKDLKLKKSKIHLDIEPLEPDEVDKDPITLDYDIQVNQLLLEEIALDLKMTDREIMADIRKLESTDGLFSLKGEDMQIEFSHFLASNCDFRYDVPFASFAEGFDANHLDLQNLTIDIVDFKYDNLDISADVTQIILKDQEDFEIKEFQSVIEFSQNFIRLQNLNLATNRTKIKSPELQIEYPFLANENVPIEQLKVAIDLSLTSQNLKDFRYFYSDLDSLSFIKDAGDSNLKINAKLIGSLKGLVIQAFRFNGFESIVNANGRIKNLTKFDDLKMDLNFDQIEINHTFLVNHIPKNRLPEFVELPDMFSLTGTLKGTIHDFKSEIEAITMRLNTPFPTKVKAAAAFQNITNLDSAYLDIWLDTLYTSKSDIIAYLPPGALPEFVDLPDRFMLKGTLQGKANDFKSNLKLLTYRAEQSNEINAFGMVSGLFTSETPSFDISVDASAISQKDLETVLPVDLLPDYFQLPIINKLSGILKGDLTNFSTNFALESNTGDWVVNAVLDNEKYNIDLDVEDLQPASFFVEDYLDSLTGFAVLPLSAELRLEGQGFDFSDDSFMDLFFKIKNAANAEMKGLVIEGKLYDQILIAKAVAQEKEIELQADCSLDCTNAIPEWKTELNLNHLDLAELGFSDLPFLVKGDFEAKVKGYDLDTLSGTGLLSGFKIQYDGASQVIDSIQLIGNFDNGKNLVRITSDFFNAQLKGQFEYPSVTNALQQQFFNYWQADSPDSLIGKTNEHFDLEFELFRPEILTMGYIPTLEKLSPFVLAAGYDNRNTALQFQTDLPYFDWQNMAFEGFSAEASGDENRLDYSIEFEEADLLNIADLLNFQIYGRIEEQQLQNTLSLSDEQQKKRFEIKTLLHFAENREIQLRFLPEQLLNYENWSVNKNNEINYGDKKLSIKNWQFFKDKESVEIEELDGEKFKVSFKDFDLKLLSDLIKFNGDYMSGILRGDISVTNPIEKPLFHSNLKIESIAILKANLGDLDINLESKSGYLIYADLNLDGNENALSLKGYLNLEDELKGLDFQLNIPGLNLHSIQPLTFGYLEETAGILSGKLDIKGSLSEPSVLGQVQLEDTEFNVEMLNTRLRLGQQPLVFSGQTIEFKDLEIFDANGNKGVMSSYILTENYRDFFLQSNIEAKDFLVLNTTAKDNDLYYGKLMTDADVSLKGKISEPIIEVTAKPKKGANLTYVYNSVSNQLELHKGVVEFIDPNKKLNLIAEREQLIQVSEELNIKIIVKANVNEDLSFKVITDPQTGDFFEGKAKGDLVYVQHPDGRMELNGNLEVVEGDYLFTYQNVIRRPFKVKPGGTVSWTGDPFNPKLDIDVTYNVRTSVYPLIASEGDGGTQAAPKQTFQVNLNIGGTPSKTEIATSVEYPGMEGNTNDSSIQSAIDQINRDVSSQNTQAFALILFNGFLAQNLANTNFQVVDLSGNINNVISQQLTGLANRYIKFVELDFGLDTYENNENNSQTDFRVSVRKRFLNNRLTISLDGKTTTETGYEESTSQTYLDNVTIEYALTPDGRFSLKIYNSRDFDDFIGGTAVKVGGALVFSKEFNGIRFFKK